MVNKKRKRERNISGNNRVKSKKYIYKYIYILFESSIKHILEKRIED